MRGKEGKIWVRYNCENKELPIISPYALAPQSTQPRNPSPASRDAKPHFDNNHGGDIVLLQENVPLLSPPHAQG